MVDSHLTSSIRGVSGLETIKHIRTLQASNLQGDNLAVDSAAITNLTVVNASITIASINKYKVVNATITNASIQKAKIINASINNASINVLKVSGQETRTAGLRRNTTRITNAHSPYTVLSADEIIFGFTGGGPATVDLPAGVEGMHYKIINCGASGNDVIVAPNGTEELYGESAGVPTELVDGEIINIDYNATEGWY